MEGGGRRRRRTRNEKRTSKKKRSGRENLSWHFVRSKREGKETFPGNRHAYVCPFPLSFVVHLDFFVFRFLDFFFSNGVTSFLFPNRSRKNLSTPPRPRTFSSRMETKCNHRRTTWLHVQGDNGAIKEATRCRTQTPTNLEEKKRR